MLTSPMAANPTYPPVVYMNGRVMPSHHSPSHREVEDPEVCRFQMLWCRLFRHKVVLTPSPLLAD